MRPDNALPPRRSTHHMPDDERRRFQNPETILSQIGLKPGDTFIDVGCGQGFFTLPAARIVGGRGQVYGVDTDRKSITDLEKSAKKSGLSNIALKVAEAENTVFCTACADIVFFGIVLHDFREPEKVLANAGDMLKAGGRLVNFDWKKVRMPFGPPFNIRFSEAKAEKLIEKAGLVIEKVMDFPPYNYLIVAGHGTNKK